MNTNGVDTNRVSNAASHAPIPPSIWDSMSPASHIAIIVGVALVVHLIVKSLRHYSEWAINRSHEKKHPFDFVTQQPKFITFTRLLVSGFTFVIYVMAIYFILNEEFRSATDSIFKTYLTSAAVVGLALSFGLQGLVQDVVTCVTLILSDAMDVGDSVDLMNGVIGRVERIGLRFTKVVNFYNQEIFVPNRNINNVSRFPQGGILAYADVQIPAKADQKAILDIIQKVSKGVWTQFGAIILSEPIFSEVESTPGGWSFVRVRFNIWPGQNALIENTFRQQMVNAIKTFEPNYADWQVVVTYRAMNSHRKA